MQHSIYKRMRSLTVDQGEDPFNEEHRSRATQLEAIEQELLKHYEGGYLNQDECMLALVRAALFRSHEGFDTYRVSWGSLIGTVAQLTFARQLIEGDIAETPVSSMYGIKVKEEPVVPPAETVPD